MCPVCIANAATFAVGVTSSGGAVALVLAKLRRIPGFWKSSPDSKIKEKQS